MKLILSLSILSIVVCNLSGACRIAPEVLKRFTKTNVERVLSSEDLESIYWDEEPLDAKALSSAIGLNITLAETRFQLDNSSKSETNSTLKNATETNFLKDIFVTCAVERDRSHALSINLELENPFKTIELWSENYFDGSSEPQTIKTRIYLPNSFMLAQLKQQIKYDECLRVAYVQLEPNVSYDIECVDCNGSQRAYMDKIFNRRMSQLDSELDSILSEKLSLGLQILFDQQRLDLDLHMN